VRGEPGAEPLVVEAVLARADSLAILGDREGARADLDVARAAAQRSGASGLLARVIAAQAAAASAAGESDGAAAFYREAARLAAESGDAAGARRWSELGDVGRARQAG
jgi:hypothetical protein